MKINLLQFKKISWKLTFIYSLIFSLVLILLNAGILYGIKFYLLKQSTDQINYSLKSIEDKIYDYGANPSILTDPELLDESKYNFEIYLRITDSHGNLMNYSSKNMDPYHVNALSHLGATWRVETGDKHLIVKNIKLNLNNKFYYIQIIKNMHQEHTFIKLLFILMAIADTLGVVFSFITGYIISKKMLKPIDHMTNAAKEISISDLNSRIEVGEANDELSRLALTFNEMLDRLKTSFEKQNQFVSDASHELRTPISVIQGYINLLDRWGKNDESVLQESIDAIKNETTNMKELTEKLLFLARGDSSKLEIHKENFLLNTLIEEIVKESTLIAPSHNITYELNEKININADKKMIKEMLRALIDNSIKFSPINSKINIHAGVLPDYVQIKISDLGIGIPEDEIHHIFDRFYRVDKARSKETGGSGLGLPIAKWIVEAHRGKISIDSTVGQGTDITIMLPNK